MKPEDITGINSQGWRVHVDGCTCEYNELTRREWVKGTSPRELRVITERLVSRKDPACAVHP
jgi:hypothetical protein